MTYDAECNIQIRRPKIKISKAKCQHFNWMASNLGITQNIAHHLFCQGFWFRVLSDIPQESILGLSFMLLIYKIIFRNYAHHRILAQN